MEKFSRYEIREELGQRGIVSVYRAYDPVFDREVSLKILRRELLHDSQLPERFVRETRIIARLEHPAIVPMYDLGNYHGQMFFATRYMTAGSLSERIQRGLSLQEIVQIILRLADALDYAHRKGIIHLDLNPGNILFDEHNNAFISDFGVTKILETQEALDSKDTTASSVGTLEYISPEQWMGKGLDGRADIYSLGIILYEMVTGRKPFTANSPSALAIKHITEPVSSPRSVSNNIPVPVEKAILKALAKDPNERFQNMGEFIAELNNLLPDKPVAATILTYKQLNSTNKVPSTSPTRIPVARESFFRRILNRLAGDTTTDVPPPEKSVDDTPAEEVSFTAYYPKEGKVESWHTLLVYAHVLSALVKIQEDAKKYDDQIKTHKEATSKSSSPILRGTELTIVPSCEGITFNPERVSFKWMEDFHRAEFRFIGDQSLSEDAAKGQIDIYAGPLIIGSLKFAMLFNDKDMSQINECEEHAQMYGKDDVFISYSRKDKEVARSFKNVLEATGLDVFLDVDDIRAGQIWRDELMRRIERAKIFQIFWSSNYSQSENCKLEWEYAVKQNRNEGYIRPVYWENPLSPNPPEELNKFNFRYVELKGR